MNCDHCGGPMIIDEWNGWVWTCYHCDHCGRNATDEEIERQEKEFARLFEDRPDNPRGLHDTDT